MPNKSFNITIFDLIINWTKEKLYFICFICIPKPTVIHENLIIFRKLFSFEIYSDNFILISKFTAISYHA